MRKLVIGDIHGSYRGMVQVLKRARFNYYHDQLISLGDIVDGWSQSRQCIDELLKVRNLILLRGNHDDWFIDWMNMGYVSPDWYYQGGKDTLLCYGSDPREVPPSHARLMRSAKLWYEDNNRLFVHAGFDPKYSILENNAGVLTWDRQFFNHVILSMQQNKCPNIELYDEIYIGHTNLLSIGTNYPIVYGGAHLLDTGGGWGGKITVMDIDTKEYWQSDLCKDLYPEEGGR